MNIVWLLLAGIVAAMIGLVLAGRRRKPSRPTRARPTRPPPAEAASVAPAPDANWDSLPPAPLQPPPELACFEMLHADTLAPARASALLEVLKDIPRPSRVLQQMLSPSWLEETSSARLVELIGAEPLFAAEVLRAARSPLYGCRTPIASVGQAVTYLGLNTVNAIALQYLLKASFKSDSLARAQALERLWATSATAGELAQRMARFLGWSHPGAVGCAGVLSTLGRVATLSAISRGTLSKLPQDDTLARVEAEQAYVGLPCSEIGRLLMRQWGLPSQVVDDAADLERVLVTPAEDFGAERAPRLALGYLSVRVAEALTQGRLTDPRDFWRSDPSPPELFHLRGYPALTAMRAALGSREVLSLGRSVSLQAAHAAEGSRQRESAASA